MGVSRAMLRKLQRCYGVPSGAVVYNGHSLRKYRPSHAKGDFVLSTGRFGMRQKILPLSTTLPN